MMVETANVKATAQVNGIINGESKQNPNPNAVKESSDSDRCPMQNKNNDNNDASSQPNLDDDVSYSLHQMGSTQQTQFHLRPILENDKLNHKNFLDWHCNLRIVLRQANKEYVLKRAVPSELPLDATQAERAAYVRHINDDKEVSCLMLACMESYLQNQFKNSTAYDMITSLKSLFDGLARTERYNTLKSLFDCKHAKGSPVSPHVIKMIGYIDKLERLGVTLHKELQTDIILHSLSDDFNSFVSNFIMCDISKTNWELHEMLQLAEVTLGIVQKGKGFEKSEKGKGKKNKTRLMKLSRYGFKPKPKTGVALEDKCHYCSELGHWKRNCKRYLADLKQGRTSS